MRYILSFVAICGAFLLLGWNHPEEKEASAVQWLTFEEAVAKAQVKPKKIFIDVYTDWCGWCKKMDATTFNDPRIAQYLNDNFYNVKLNGEQKEEIIFRGYTFKFVPSGRRGYHELAAALMNNRLSYPTVVFMDEQQNIIAPVPGYQQPPGFDRLLKFIGEDHYKSESWDNFTASYQSSF